MYDDEITPEMYQAGCFQDELLVTWFKNLLDTVVALHQSNYVTLCEIESPNIIEFSKQKDRLVVREVREIFDQRDGIPAIEEMGRPIILLESHKYKVQLRSGKYVEKEVRLSETNFNKVSILPREFEEEVLAKAEQFVGEIASQYPWLMPSRTFKALAKRIENVKLLIGK